MDFIKSRYKEIFIWTAYFLLLVSVGYGSWGTIGNGLEVAFFMVFVHAIIFYFNYYVLMPTTFAKQRYLLFFFASILFTFCWFSFIYFVFYAAFTSGYWLAPEEFDTFGGFRRFAEVQEKELLWTARIGFGGINVFFISVLYFNAEQIKLKKQQLLELNHEKISAEIKLLRMQINPHFLFNALNNIYSKAVLEKSEVADSIHKLSALLRYALHEGDADRIALVKELEYIDNYIDLQKLKDEYLDSIELTVDGNITSTTIVPMLLISFVENAFKHSNIGEGGWIKIHIKAVDNSIEFSCINSISVNEQVKDNASGIGLINVKKRLNLNYPSNHQLTINKTINNFEINLIINNDHKVLDN